MPRLTHLGLLYRDEQELLDHSVPFVRQGLDLGEPVLVAQPQACLDRLSEQFAGETGIAYVDIQEAGRNPARILPWIFHSFALKHGQRKVRILGEPIWPGRSEFAYPACVQHEAVVNLALSDVDVTVLCTYDSSALPQQAIADSYYTHPLMFDDGARDPKPSPVYAEADLHRHYFTPLPPPPPGSSRLAFGLDDLRAVRELVAAQAAAVGMEAERAGNLRLAATEAATNAILHGGGRGVLHVWGEGDAVVCEFQSDLPLPSPLAGSLQVPPLSSSGRGLAIINHLCDLVRWYAGDGHCALRFWFSSAGFHQVTQPALG